jgi:RHS repeat-associated protein
LTNDGAGRTFEWDAAGRLAAINYTNSNQRSEFAYDGLNRRVKIIEKTNGSVTSEKRFVWEGMTIVQERNGGNSLYKRFFPDGQLFDNGYYGYPGYVPPAVLYMHDHLGSVRTAVNSTGNTAYDYDPYGKKTASGYSYYSSDFGYTGHYEHGPSGLVFAPFRVYDRDLGRWLSRDPAEESGGLNLYQYAQNATITLVDPDGRSPAWALPRELANDPSYAEAYYKEAAKAPAVFLIPIAALCIPAAAPAAPGVPAAMVGMAEMMAAYEAGGATAVLTAGLKILQGPNGNRVLNEIMNISANLLTRGAAQNGAITPAGVKALYQINATAGTLQQVR